MRGLCIYLARCEALIPVVRDRIRFTLRLLIEGCHYIGCVVCCAVHRRNVFTLLCFEVVNTIRDKSLQRLIIKLLYRLFNV